MPKKQIAVYLRLSLEDTGANDESNSITAQRGIIAQFIQGQPELASMKTVEFVDDGYSGTNFDRPGFKRMMAMVRSGDISCIIVKDLSRFARNYIEAGDYLEHIFPYLGIRFIAVNNHYDSNQFIGTTGGIDVAFRNFMYEMYSVDISKKVKASQHMLMRNGRYVSNCPYGYTKIKGQKHHMVPDPETSPIVRDIFLWAIEGKKSTEIARILNEKHIPTPMQHKKLSRQGMDNDAMWSHQAVIRIIRDYKYTGAIRDAPCAGIHWSRTNIEDVVFTTYKRQLQIVSEEYRRTVSEKQPDKLVPLRAKQKSLRVQLGGIGGKVASLYEQFRSDEISRNAFLEKKSALSEDRDRLQTELSRIEDEIESLLQKQKESNTAMNAIKNIAAAADEPDDKLRERMYDDIDRVIVFDNENLKIEWKFDVAFQLS